MQNRNKLVIQEDETGCGIAAISMITGIPYKTVKEKAMQIFTPEWGMTNGEVVATLNHLGYPATDAVKQFGTRLTCILLVPSLNMEQSGHYIFYSPQTGYLDPNEGRVGKKFYDQASNPLVAKIICLISDPQTKNSLINLISNTENELQRINKFLKQ